jgi:hypothetical protein
METSIRKSTPLYRHAYLYFLAVMVITIVAFFPSYFNRLGQTDAAHHLHGITASLWLLMLVVQPFLYARGLLQWHRRLGKFSFVLAPLIVLSALIMIRSMLQAREVYPPLIPYQLAFIDFFTLLLFIYFYAQAIIHRKKIHLHSRFLVCTVLGPLIPTLTRFFFILIPAVDSFDKSLNLSYAVVEIILVALIWDDKRRGCIQKPYVIALGLFLVQHVFMNFASNWLWWRSWMDMFSGI